MGSDSNRIYRRQDFLSFFIQGGKLLDTWKKIGEQIGISLKKFIQAKLVAMGINLVVFLIGFFILKVKHWILLGIVTTIVDALPFVGGGVILMPWSIIALIQGQGKLAGGLILLFILSFLIHQIVEPLIIGKSVGLNPLYSFGIMVGALLIFGPWGAIIGSLATIVLSAVVEVRKINNRDRDYLE